MALTYPLFGAFTHWPPDCPQSDASWDPIYGLSAFNPLVYRVFRIQKSETSDPKLPCHDDQGAERPMTPIEIRNTETERLERAWRADERWRGIERGYTAA